MKKFMALSGSCGKAALELWEDSATRARLKPPCPGEIWLCGPDGSLFLVDGRRVCPFAPLGGIVLREGRVVLQGGFAGRQGLLNRARRELMGRAVPGPLPQPKPPQPEPEPEPKPPQPQPESKPEPQPRPPQPQPEPPPEPAPQPASGPPRTQQGPSGAAQAGQPRVPEGQGTPNPARQPKPPPRAPQSQAVAEILKKARELFGPAEVQPPQRGPQPLLNPFPKAFPMSRWKRVGYPGTDRYYLEGELYKNGAGYLIHALPGEYRPGKRPQGFDRFLRGRDGSGYWVKISRK